MHLRARTREEVAAQAPHVLVDETQLDRPPGERWRARPSTDPATQACGPTLRAAVALLRQQVPLVEDWPVRFVE